VKNRNHSKAVQGQINGGWMIGEILSLAGAVVEIVDRQLPGWEARARKRLARLEALEQIVKLPRRRERLRIRIQALKALLDVG